MKVFLLFISAATISCGPVSEPEDICSTGSPLPGNCGRGGSRCPSGYLCNIDPADRYAVCCPEADPGNFAMCPTGSPLPDINCGRGGSRCPSGYVCNIDPADRYAVCCSEGKPGNPTNCPKERPEFNSPCNSSEDSARCEYGNQTCCGESFPAIIMECVEDTWAGLAVETPCFMQGHSCGPVTKLPPQNCNCPEIYSPVCGTNGQTYSNTCFARCEAQTAACEGECPCTSDCICLAVFSPVCGADGQTYSNSCQAGCVNAKVACEGECPCGSDCICPAVFTPVCGVDGQTYSNGCEAGCANAGVGCEGECPCA